MPTDNEFERDFENVAGRRFPGRFDPREFNNVEDAGDGIPGLQKCFRNYLHEGGMEKALDMNNQDIEKIKDLDVDGDIDAEGDMDLAGSLDIHTDLDVDGTANLDNTDIDGTLDVSGEVDLHSDLDLHNGNIDDVATIDGGGNAVQLDDDISLPANNITLGAGQTVDGIDVSAVALDNMPTAPTGDIPVNSQQITGLADGVAAQDAMAFGQKYTDVNARASINDIFGADGKADSNIDLDDHDLDNIKNIDGNIWFCSTRSEIQTAIDTIAGNAGTIILLSGNIDLSGTPIDIDQGGSYVIQGQGDVTVIDCGGDNSAFNITSAVSCVLRDFKIDAIDLTTSTKEIINIIEGSNNPITIDNITIVGDGTNGWGIELNSNNIIVTNCNISLVAHGIVTQSSGNAYYNMINGNYCYSCGNGILLYSHRNMINGNYCYSNTYNGILSSNGDNNMINGNYCYSNANGIEISGGDANSMNGNYCYINTGNGIEIAGNNNTVVGNTCLSNSGTNLVDNGVNTFGVAYNNVA